MAGSGGVIVNFLFHIMESIFVFLAQNATVLSGGFINRVLRWRGGLLC
ncbi:hypothetical protein DDI_3802 [Dickeya dianthicola RNS04.9]|nr:hypothetical protein DDI_3802 [Dickeya dianthicola RNS04.9]